MRQAGRLVSQGRAGLPVSFGGRSAVDAAHELFHADCRRLLAEAAR
ncbi:hypothetical protein [Streptomyces adustus]|nr:hypothetical protein [Streptomyces adustus]